MRNHITSLALAAAAACLLTPGASAQSTSRYRMIAGPTSNHGGPAVSASSPRRIVHWDLREFPDCKVPYSFATGQSDSPDNEFIAWNAAIDTWRNVTPAVVDFTWNPAFTMTNAPGQDGINILSFFNGYAAFRTHFPTSGGGDNTTSNVIGLTCIWTNGSAQLQESDIIFNDTDWQWRTGNNYTDKYKFTTGNQTAAGYPIANGDTLMVSIDGAAAITITFNAPAITAGAATAAEIATVMNARFGVLGTGATAFTFGAGNNASVGFRSTRAYDGMHTVRVTGGTAAGKARFFAVDAAALRLRTVDIESVAVHELGHFLGFHHSVSPGGGGGPIMQPFVVGMGAPVRAATAEDVQLCNYVYTPDMGDAPDPFMGMFNKYQTKVHTTTNRRVLNGVNLTAPGKGPYHERGFAGPGAFANDRFEWLGANMDDHASECEARATDNFDDGVTMPSPLQKGRINRITVTINTTRQVGRYRAAAAATDDVVISPPCPAAGCGCGAGGPTTANRPIIGPGPNGVLETALNNCNPAGDDVVDGMGRITTGADGIVDTVINRGADTIARQALEYNGYMDFPADGLFNPGDLTLWWEGTPAVAAGGGLPAVACSTMRASANFVGPAVCAGGAITLNFDVFVPANAADTFWCRHRLDYGEDEGRVLALSGDLRPAEGAAAFGEVEDYECTAEIGEIPDDCTDSIPVPDGMYVVDTETATTDGPPHGVCTFFGDDQVGCDVWFCYTASCTGVATASLCGSSYDTKLAVYNTCSCPVNDPIACNDDYCGLQSLVNFPAVEGDEYLIRVGGYQCAVGIAKLTLYCTDIDCPPDAAVEEEPNCGLPTNTVNGGCNSDPPVFGAISCNAEVCGTAAFDGSTRDTDWYEFTLTENSYVTWCVRAEFAFDVFILDGNCPPAVIESGNGLLGETVCLNAALNAGTYRVFVAPSFFGEPVPCDLPNRYVGQLYCKPTFDPVTQACCFADGTCQDLDPLACADLMGKPQGEFTSCASFPCPQPTEACCLPDGNCLDVDVNFCQLTLLGYPQGPGSTCATTTCYYPVEACCFCNGTCVDMDPDDCLAAEGMPGGPGSLCGTQPPCPCVGDVNGDHFVSLADVARVIACWGQPPSCNPAADLDGSGTIGVGDIAIIILKWAQVCP